MLDFVNQGELTDYLGLYFLKIVFKKHMMNKNKQSNNHLL